MTKHIDTPVAIFIGSEFDAEVFTNGGDYHKVVAENVETGEKHTHKFYSRARAMEFARQAAEQGQTI
jgi:hypothetical protein